jgi:hypothetical protein
MHCSFSTSCSSSCTVLSTKTQGRLAVSPGCCMSDACSFGMTPQMTRPLPSPSRLGFLHHSLLALPEKRSPIWKPGARQALGGCSAISHVGTEMPRRSKQAEQRRLCGLGIFRPCQRRSVRSQLPQRCGDPGYLYPYTTNWVCGIRRIACTSDIS